MRLRVSRWTLARSRVNLTFAHPAPGIQEGLVYWSDGVERMVWGAYASRLSGLRRRTRSTRREGRAHIPSTAQSEALWVVASGALFYLNTQAWR